ncbi:MAG: M50 family metallopeptidase [Thermoanaerobaculia bacterium]
MNGRRGWHIGSFGFTTVYVEAGFLILIGIFMLLDLERGVELRLALLWIPTLFVSILVHELAHAATISALGFGTSEVYLSSFGGVTVNRRKARPWQDILISAAGPISSVFLWWAFGAMYRTVPIVRHDPMLAALFPLMSQINLVWAIFNFLPIYPLDGGGILENFLRILTSPRRALIASIWISMIFGGILVALSLWFRQFFIAIVAGMLLMQNFQRWSFFRSGGDGEGGPGAGPPPGS